MSISSNSYSQKSLDKFTDKASIVVKTLQLVNQQREQQYKNMQLQMQQANLQAYLSPQVMSPPNQIFPQCPRISQSAPAPSCMVNSEQDLSMAKMILSSSEQHTALYSQHASPTNEQYGLGCLQKRRIYQKTIVEEKLNELTKFEDELKANLDKFKENMTLHQRNMDIQKDKLEGGNSAKDINAENRDLTQDLPACSGIISGENMIGVNSGLYKIKADMDKSSGDKKSLISSSAHYLQNKKRLENDVDRLKSRIFGQINSAGIDDWTANFNQTDLTKGGMTLFKPAKQAIISKIRQMKVARQRIEKQLKSKELLGKDFTPPDFSSNFKEEINKTINDTVVFEKKKFVQDCVFDDPSKGGKGIGLDNIMSGIKQTNIEGGGTTVSQYKTALNRILSSNSFIQDKLQRIKNLEKTFGLVIQVIYKNNAGRRTSSTPYNILKKSVDNCQKFFNSDQSLSTQNTRMRSKKYRLEKAEKYLTELKNLESQFVMEMQAEINDRVVNCSGVELDKSSCQNKMTPSSDNFCLKHATECAQTAQNCYKEAKKEIQKTVNLLQAHAAKYNEKIEEVTGMQQLFLNRVNSVLINEISIPLKRMFPTTNFTIPEGLTLKLPELQSTDHNLLLRGGGNLGFLKKDLPRKLTLLKLGIIKQTKKADQIADQYIKDFKGEMEKAEEEWLNTKNQCTQAISDFMKVQSELKGEMAEKKAEAKEEREKERDKARSVCNKFNKLKNNPLGGCDGDFSASSLYKDANEITYFVRDDPEILKVIGDFDNLCGLNQNESKEDGDKKDDTPEIVKLCRGNGNDWDKVKKKIGRDVYDKLSNNQDLSSKEKKYIKSSLGIKKDDESFDTVELKPKLKNIIEQSNNIFERKPLKFTREAEKIKSASDTLFETLKNNIKTYKDDKKLKSIIKEKNLNSKFRSIARIDDPKKLQESIEKLSRTNKDLVIKGFIDDLKEDLEDINDKIKKEDKARADQKIALEKDKDDENNICLNLDNFLRSKARSYCKDKKDRHCFEEEFGNAQKNLGHYKELNGQINDLYYSTENSKKALLTRKWSDLGESYHGIKNPCISQNRDSHEDKVFDEVSEYLDGEDLDTINR